MVARTIKEGFGGKPYTLIARPGVYNYYGAPAKLRGPSTHTNYTLTANTGTYAYTGFTAGLAWSGASWQLPAGHYVNSGLPLAIVAPVNGLSTTNRYYLAYPGVLYRVPVVCQGGAHPYQYTLTSAPSGMTIGQHYGDVDYGVINWSNPITSGSPFTVTALVTDQLGATASVTWTVTVASTNFLFVDPVNGSPSSANGGTGAGTFANPLKTFDDIYSGATGHAGSNSARKADATYANKFVYIRSGGTLTTAQVNFEAGNSGQRAPFVSSNKPKVWMGYPGDPTPTIDTTGSYMESYSDGTVGYWFSDMNAAGMETTGGYKWFGVEGPTCDNGFFGINFQTPTGVGGGGTNPAMIFFVANAPAITSRNIIKNCVWNDTLNHEPVLGYGTAYVCIHDCTMAGVNDVTGWYAKDDIYTFWSVRGCTGLAANSVEMVRMDCYPATAGSGNIEICWNNYKSSGPGVNIGTTPGSTVNGVYLFRNSWQVAEQLVNGGAVAGLVVTSDVVKYTNASANAHGWQLINSGTNTSPSYSNEECVGLNFADINSTTGKLQGPSRSTYLGIRGYEVA